MFIYSRNRLKWNNSRTKVPFITLFDGRVCQNMWSVVYGTIVNLHMLFGLINVGAVAHVQRICRTTIKQCQSIENAGFWNEKTVINFILISHGNQIFFFNIFYSSSFQSNSIPPTTTVANLIEKHKATEGQIYVDVGFWGGIIPGNEDELEPLLSHGVVGFKCFLCPSGVEEFPNVTEADVKLAYEKLQHLNALIAVCITSNFFLQRCVLIHLLTLE